MSETTYINAIELAYGKGRLKQWAFETIILDALYNTKPANACYLKLKDISSIKADKETDEEIILRYGYMFRLPKSEIDLHIVKRDHLMYLTKEGVGIGYEKVEEEIVKFLIEQKKQDNLYFRTNFNGEEYKIK